MESVLYFIRSTPYGFDLEAIDLQEYPTDADLGTASLGYGLCLDRKTVLSGGTYNAGGNVTTYVFSSFHTGSSPVYLIKGGDWGASAGTLLTNQYSSNSPTAYSIVVLTGDTTGHSIIMALGYTFRYQLSPQYIKDTNGAWIATANLQMRNITFQYANSGDFTVNVTPKLRSTYTYSYSLTYPSTGEQRTSVLSDGMTTTIELTSTSPWPLYVPSAEWEALYSLRNTRLPPA